MSEKQAFTWRSRIVGTGKIAVDDVLFHPMNPKIHPDIQRETLREIIGALGQLAPIIVNQRNGMLVDGEERSWLASAIQAETGERVELDVIYVDLSEAEHEQALISFDAVGDLALPDPARLKELLQAHAALGPNDEKLRELLQRRAGSQSKDSASHHSMGPHTIICPECGAEFEMD